MVGYGEVQRKRFAHTELKCIVQRRELVPVGEENGHVTNAPGAKLQANLFCLTVLQKCLM